MELMEQKLLYTQEQAAKLLNLSTKTLYRLRKAGKLQFVRVGNAIRYDIESLRSLIQSTKTFAIG